jgi:hypothetical protein
MKSLSIILTMLAMASPFAAHAANGKEGHSTAKHAAGIVALATGNVAYGCVCSGSNDQDPDPYVVRG